MSCQCQQPKPDKIVVASVTTTPNAYRLVTAFALSTLTANADFVLELDPEKLVPDDANKPVVLFDGSVTLPLGMVNGNNMRESVFRPLVCRQTRCGCPARVRCFYGNDPAHALVWPVGGRMCH